MAISQKKQKNAGFLSKDTREPEYPGKKAGSGKYKQRGSGIKAKDREVIYGISSAKQQGNVTHSFAYKRANSIIMEGTAFKPESEMTSLEKMQLVEDGISKNALEAFKEKTEFDYNQLAEVLSVARATLINKKGKAKFSAELSEKILSIADIYSYGYEVFEDEDRFNEWILRPNQSLGGKSPYALLNNSFGREEVKSLIGRIDYGVYS